MVSSVCKLHVNNIANLTDYQFTSNGDKFFTATAPPDSRLESPPSQWRHSALALSRNTTAPIILLYTSDHQALPNSLIEALTIFR